MSEAWPYALLTPTVWHAEYEHWLQRPFMRLFDAIPLGSPKSLPPEERQRRTVETKRRLSAALARGAHLMIFAEGSIGDGVRAEVPPGLSGVYDLLAAHPDKPLLLIDVRGLERSRFGRAGPKPGPFERLDVRLVIRRFDNVSLDGGPPALNARIERFFNEGAPL
jgi:1-acyl-sn-glycerol-3-phosphate acyltransferase